MQYLKEDVKDKIIKAALKEFEENGYMNSSMRVIAHNAGIVMGNIYRYFKNKEALFNYTVGPVYEKISAVFSKIQIEIKELEGPWEDQQALELIKYLYDQILQTFSGHEKELLILLDKSSGSKYQDTKKEIIAQIQKILEIRLVPELNLKDNFILNVLSCAYVEGVCVVLRNTECNNKEAVIESLSKIMLCQISKRI